MLDQDTEAERNDSEDEAKVEFTIEQMFEIGKINKFPMKQLYFGKKVVSYVSYLHFFTHRKVNLLNRLLIVYY